MHSDPLDCKVAYDLAKHGRGQSDYQPVVCPECSGTEIDYQEKVWVRREILGMTGGVLQVSGAYEELDDGFVPASECFYCTTCGHEWSLPEEIEYV